MRYKKGIIVILAAIIVGAAGFAFTSMKNDERAVKIAYLPAVLALQVHMMTENHMCEEVGITCEFVPMTTSNEAYDALVRGDIDIVQMASFMPVLLNNNKSPGIAKTFGLFDMNKEDTYDYLIVKNDSPVQNLTNLSGKKIGVFPGTTQVNFLKKFLTDKGVDIAAIEFVPIPPQTQLAALAAGSIDALGIYNPGGVVALSSGEYRALATSIYAEVYPHAPLATSIINTTFVTEHEKLANKAMAILEDAAEDMRKNPEARNILAKHMKLDQKIADAMPLPPYLEITTDDMQQFIDFLVSIGELKETVNAADVTLTN